VLLRYARSKKKHSIAWCWISDCQTCLASKYSNNSASGKEQAICQWLFSLGRELSLDEDIRLHDLARSVVVKDVESPERLLDETSLFLHRVISDLPLEKQKMLDRLHHSDDALVGKKVGR